MWKEREQRDTTLFDKFILWLCGDVCGFDAFLPPVSTVIEFPASGIRITTRKYLKAAQRSEDGNCRSKEGNSRIDISIPSLRGESFSEKIQRSSRRWDPAYHGTSAMYNTIGARKSL